VGDGGDGTGELIVQRFKGTRVSVEVRDPLDRNILASYGLIDSGRTAVIELASASGLRLLQREELDPLRATTFGTGQVIRSALDAGVRRILLAVGGSATVDAGTGILRALGARFLDSTGAELSSLPQGLTKLESIDLNNLDPRIRDCELVVLCDVENPLLGERGSARVFGPQKGASPDSVRALESGLAQFGRVVLRQTGVDVDFIARGGAAGGMPAGLYALAGAKLVRGIDYFLDLTGFDEALRNADLVITGEGRMDNQTLEGKAPMGVARRAREKGRRVVALAGSVDASATPALAKYFDEVRPIVPESTPLDVAFKDARRNLELAAFEWGDSLAI
jgi:glycerate kinase